MDPFLDNAERLLETAAAPGGILERPEWVVLVGPDSAIRMLAETDWPLESLRLHHGARMAYRVSRTQGKVRVEGRADRRSCILERHLGLPGGFLARAGSAHAHGAGSGVSREAPPRAASAPAGPEFARLSLLRIHRT
ncbi:MAG TPA: hypothetical protein VNJ11_17595 [Bryobacteraceae bacterium]|nr:hypothetical protein [Bryobacteraceae bacterium]